MKIESTTHIDAPAQVVWAVSEDVERWPDWNPNVTSLVRLDQGPFVVGSAALTKQPGLPQARWVVTSLVRGQSFAWETRVRGIRLIGSHLITPADAGVQSTLRIEMAGLVACVLWPWVRVSARRLLEKENAGLKRRCESLVAARTPEA